MIARGNTSPGGGLVGKHVPIPTAPRPIAPRPRRTGFDWPTAAAPDPDAVDRLVALGVVTVTEEVVDERPVKVVRKRRPKPARKRTPGPSTGFTYPPRFDVDKAVQLYLSGMTVRQVADALGVKQNSSIRHRLTQRGITLRPAVRATRHHNHPVEQVAADYVAGESIRALAVKYGASKATIARILSQQEVTFRPEGRPKPDAKRSW